MYTHVTDFIPWGKTYAFGFDKYNCYYKKCGKCSLKKMNLPYNLNRYEKWQKEFCPNLASSILQHGFFQAATDVIVIQNSCGHYAIDDGQHRICVCARLKVPMKIVLLKSDEECRICSISKRSIFKKISCKLGLGDEILIKF